MRTLIGSLFFCALAITSGASAAFAHEGEDHSHAEVEIHTGGINVSSHGTTSTTHEDHGAKDTMHDRADLRKFAQAAFVLKHGVPGLVTSVAADSFVMTVPAGKDHATSSVTVNVSSSTKFTHASTTAVLADITAGTRVEVLGKMSATSDSIAAERVIIGAKGEDLHKAKARVFDRIRDFFTGKHATTTNAMITARGSAAAEVGGGFVNRLLHKVFGWM